MRESFPHLVKQKEKNLFRNLGTLITIKEKD